MAALVAGVQYGLSSHSNFHENKSLIFVKLTDSAQRAIEDFLKNRNKTSVNPTIQFLGNQGQLSFPSTQSSHGSAGFTFSLSGNHDIEGPQGGFECIHQTSTKNLESLGALPCKMRIQANDDVYETTRHRMAVAEETSKNKCTRVIKANGPDIGRKVKVKAQGRTIPPPVNRHREPPSIPSNNSQLSRLSSSSSSSHQSNSSTSTPLSALLMSNSYKPISSNPPVRSQPDKKLSELVRRPLKERLIHVLALRPYKKPELYDRITREGIKDRDRSTMTTILKQVAFMRDNTYHLHRHVWNDVQEDWPFYTEQDRAMLKRRKPQNLTPPGSSDGGSSGSGQSPNSTHPGSPPAITAPPASLMSTKRPGYYQGNDGLQTKRPRISHYRKPEPTIISTSNSNVASNHSSCRENSRTTGVNGSSDNVSKNDWENSSSRGQQHRNDFRADRTGSDVISRSYGTNKPCLTPTSDSEDNHSRDNNQHSSVTMTTEENKIYKSDDLRSSIDVRSTTVGYGDSPNGLNDRNNRHDRNDRTDRNDRNDRKERDGPNNEREHSERDNTNSYNEFPSLGSSTYPGNSANSVTASLIPSSPTIQSNKGSEYPDYLTQYMAISSTEQRRRYKAEFNADYEEYRKLHTQVAKVSRRFAQLEERRQRELENGNYEKSEVLKQQIVAEYMNTKRDPAHIETKKRFHYLHEKLSHIKRLVLEYDTQTFSSGLTTSSNTTNNDDDMIDGGSLRY